MPRVPTLLAGEQLSAPTFSSQTDPESFGANPGLDNFAHGLSQLSGGAERLSHGVNSLQRQRNDEVDERWVGDASYAERNHLNEWQANPENNSSEDFANNFKTYAESRMKEYEGKAPSKRAEQMFRQHMQSFVEQRYHGALLTSERTRVENTKDSIISQTSLALGTYRGSGEVPNVEATQEVMWAHQDLRDRVERIYEKVDPTIRRKLGAYLDSEFALGVGPNDPDTAKSIIKGSKDLTEEAKMTLINRVESMERDAKVAGRDNFNRFRGDYEILLREGKRKDPIPLSEYLNYYDKDSASKLKAEDDFKARVYGRVNEDFAKLAGTTTDNQNRALNSRKEGMVSREDDATLKILSEKLHDVQELQKKDPVSWLSQYNSEVTESVKRVAAAPDGSKDAPLHEKNLALLKFQGPPPNGDPNPERYLNIPLLDRRVMSLGEAQKNQEHINSGTPPEVIKRIDDVLASYPGFEDMAFNNMSDGSHGVRQDYRLVWQNKNQWWVQSFIGALGETKGMAALTDERKGALDKEVDNNPTWKKFRMSQVGPDPTLAGELAGFKQGIMTYANYFASSQNLKMSSAVDKAVDQLLNSTMGPTTVNGRTVFVMKERPGKQSPRSNEEVSDIGRRLSVALKDIDPREIDQHKFTALNGLGKEGGMDRLQALRDHITRNGYFVPDHDGQSMILYTTGDAGIPFPVTDKNNRPFLLKLDDLPKFIRFQGLDGKPVYDLDMSPESLKKDPGLRYRQIGPENPKKTYDLQGFPDSAGVLDKTLWHWGGVYYKSTYWPTNSGYWRRKGEPPGGPGSAGVFKRWGIDPAAPVPDPNPTGDQPPER